MTPYRARLAHGLDRLKAHVPQGPLSPATHRLIHYAEGTLARDVHGALAVAQVMGLVFVVLGAILTFIVIGALISPFLGATSSITENFTDGDAGDPGANNLLAALGPVIPILAVIFLFALIIGAFVLRD